MSVPLSDTRLTEIEVRAAHLADYVVMPDEAETLAGLDVPALVAEVRRLRAESEGRRQSVTAANASTRVLERQVREKTSELDRIRAELAAERAKVHAVETVKCWTNEDGRRFVFAEDLAFALGYTPTTDAPTA